MPDDLCLIEYAQLLYDKCEDGSAPGAQAALIDLRNLMPELIAALRAAAVREAEFIEIPRLQLGPQP